MTTALDTCVLLDVLQGSGPHAHESLEALSWAGTYGRLVVSEVVYAELAGFTRERTIVDLLLSQLGIQILALGADAAYRAGMMFAAYRRSGGQHNRIITDFLIGAHALAHADQLLTRDRGFYREYFTELQIMDATAGDAP